MSLRSNQLGLTPPFLRETLVFRTKLPFLEPDILRPLSLQSQKENQRPSRARGFGKLARDPKPFVLCRCALAALKRLTMTKKELSIHLSVSQLPCLQLVALPPLSPSLCRIHLASLALLRLARCQLKSFRAQKPPANPETSRETTRETFGIQKTTSKTLPNQKPEPETREE